MYAPVWPLESPASTCPSARCSGEPTALAAKTASGLALGAPETAPPSSVVIPSAAAMAPTSSSRCFLTPLVRRTHLIGSTPSSNRSGASCERAASSKKGERHDLGKQTDARARGADRRGGL